MRLLGSTRPLQRKAQPSERPGMSPESFACSLEMLERLRWPTGLAQQRNPQVEVIATVHSATPAIVEQALVAAEAAQAEWAAMTGTERGRILQPMSERITEAIAALRSASEISSAQDALKALSGLGYVGTVNETSRYTIGTTTSGSGVGFWFNGGTG